MKQGDFTTLAKNYKYRTGYSLRVLKALAAFMGAERADFKVADIGAGTGKLTENLVSLGLDVVAVEPNDAMRAEGIKNLSATPVKWFKGSGEETGLVSQTYDWVLMGSSFHWTDSVQALNEFQRILKPHGFFTALWNPRDLERSELHQRIEQKIYEIAPEIKRVSSGSKAYTNDLEVKLLASGQFDHLLFMEAPHQVHMSQERYLGAWRSVNDIQAQAGETKFKAMMNAIEAEIAPLDEVIVPYKTRAWTVQSVT